MARPKKPDFSNHALRIQETCKKFKYDPFERAILVAVETIPIPAGYKVPERMLARYDQIPNEDGSSVLVLSKEKQADLAVKLMPYCYPALRATESKEQVDYNITWQVKQFTINAVAAPAAPKPIDVEVKKIEDKDVD